MSRNPGEPKHTVRQDWEEFSGEIQGDIDYTLDYLALEIDAANARLADLYVNEPDEAGRVAEDLVEFLDSKWGHKDEIMMVTGAWHYPRIAMGAAGIMVTQAKTDAFNIAYSNGFMVNIIEHNGQEVPRVGLSFIADKIAISTPVLQSNEIHLMAFAEPNEVSLRYLRPGSTEVVGGSLDEVAHALGTADALLNAYLNHEASDFYRQSAKKQEAFLRKLITSVEDVLPAPDSLDKVIVDQVGVDKIYFRNKITGKVDSCAGSPDQARLTVTGDVLGVTLLDVYVDGFGTKYNYPDDMMSSGEGLCLIVKPRELNFDMTEYGSPDLVMPLHTMDSPEIKII